MISNYHFNRNQQDNLRFVACNPSDCTVGLKFSCTEFATEKSLGNLYHFDKNGAIFPYSTFVSLIKDCKFQGDFMVYAKEKYEEVEGPLAGEDQGADVDDLAPVDTAQRGGEEEEEEGESDQDISGLLPKRSKKTGKNDKNAN